LEFLDEELIPISSYSNYCAATKDNALTTVEAHSPVREALFSLSVCPSIGTHKKPTQAGGGFLECATILNFTTTLM
jgi:hypothetical protein